MGLVDQRDKTSDYGCINRAKCDKLSKKRNEWNERQIQREFQE